MVVTAMTQGNVRALIAPARAGGLWNGANGIGSSLANNNGKAIGYALASDIFAAPGTFLGQSFALTDILVRYTVNGDANLDGGVTFDDLLRVAQNYDTVVAGKVWSQGDFTYDNLVNFDDLLALAQQYNQALVASSDDWSVVNEVGGNEFAADWALAVSMVPEPTSLSVMTGGLMVLRRRR
jgi:hypothetical protein